MHRIIVIAIALGLALGAAACGKRGPLDRPEPDKQEEDSSG